MDSGTLGKLTKLIDGYEKEAIDLQTELCKRPALGPVNGGDGEKDKAEFLKSYLKRIGVTDVREFNAPDDRVSCGYRPNIVATIPGESDAPKIWIMTHMDVVPPGDLDKWDGDPWTVRVEGDQVFGRGTEDNQQGMVSSLLAAKAIAAAGVKPKHTFGLVLCADEETGNDYGVCYLLEHHRELFGKDDIIIIPDAGNNKGTAIEVAEKSILWMRFHTHGKQTHGSTPAKGRNAHKAAAHLVTKLDGLYTKFRKKNSLFDPPISTFEPTRKDANVPNVNTVPGEDIFYFDCRVLPHYKLGEVIKAAKQIAKKTEKKYKVKIKVDFPQREQAAPETPADAPVAKSLTKAVRDLRKRKPKPLGIGGGTVGKFFREAGFPCAIWATQDEVAHTVNEYCRVSAMIADAKVFAHVALQEH